jgi:hypothetical protein
VLFWRLLRHPQQGTAPRFMTKSHHSRGWEGLAGNATATHLASRRIIAAGAEVQVHPAALPLDLIDLVLAREGDSTVRGSVDGLRHRRAAALSGELPTLLLIRNGVGGLRLMLC